MNLLVALLWSLYTYLLMLWIGVKQGWSWRCCVPEDASGLGWLAQISFFLLWAFGLSRKWLLCQISTHATPPPILFPLPIISVLRRGHKIQVHIKRQSSHLLSRCNRRTGNWRKMEEKRETEYIQWDQWQEKLDSGRKAWEMTSTKNTRSWPLIYSFPELCLTTASAMVSSRWLVVKVVARRWRSW